MSTSIEYSCLVMSMIARLPQAGRPGTVRLVRLPEDLLRPRGAAGGAALRDGRRHDLHPHGDGHGAPLLDREYFSSYFGILRKMKCVIQSSATGATDQAAEGEWRWQGSGELVGDFVWTSGVLTIHNKKPGHHHNISFRSLRLLRSLQFTRLH